MKHEAWVNEKIVEHLMQTGYYETEREAVSEIENAYQNLQYDTASECRTNPKMSAISDNMKDANIEMDFLMEFMEGYHIYEQEHPYE